LVEYEGEYYFIDDYAKIVKDKVKYVTNKRGLCYPDGTLIPDGKFYFDAEGKMQYLDEDGFIKGGLYEENGELYFYRYGVLYGAGLIWTGSYEYYYINSSGKAVTNVTRTVVYSKTNGLLPPGVYTFGPDGKMIDPPDKPEEPEIKNGLVWDACGDLLYYVNNEPTDAGLVIVDGYYYYITSSWAAARSETVYIPEKYTNGLLPAGEYTFDDQCRMIID
jgi:hypothetical protein